MYNRSYNCLPGARHRRVGFSLVEVLVAIALLTIGIVAFLSIFPGGFFSLQVMSNVSSADRLAQAELSRLTAGNGAEIQQIAAVEQIYSDGTVQLDPNFQPDFALTQQNGLPNSGPTGTAISTGFNENVGWATPIHQSSYEYVAGEPVNVSAPPPASAGGPATPPSSILLDYGPFLLPKLSGGALFAYPNLDTYDSLDPNTHQSFFIHGAPWQSIAGNSSYVTNLTGTGLNPISYDDPEVELTQDAPQYLIDDSADAIALHQPTGMYPEKFIMQATFVMPIAGSSPPATQTKSLTLIFEADWTNKSASPPTNDFMFWNPNVDKPMWMSLTGATAVDGTVIPAGSTIVAGSDELVRDFNMVTTFDSDPYEFELPAAVGTDPAGDSIYLGQIQFNPLIRQVIDQRGLPIQALVDYIVQDWHTIHEDRTVGTQSNTVFGTTGNSVIRLTLNHLMQSGFKNQYGQAFPGIGDNAADSVIVYDIDTQQILSQGTAGPNTYTIDYADGTVTMYGADSGEHLRIFYQPTTDWGISMLKAPSSYRIIDNTTVGSSDAPTTTGEAIMDEATNAGSLYFPICDSGRMVHIGGTVTYSNTAVSPAQQVTQPIDLLETITAQTGQLPNTADSVNLLSAMGLPATDTFVSAAPTVTGAALTVRVVWRERNLWRYRDVTEVDLPSAQ